MKVKKDTKQTKVCSTSEISQVVGKIRKDGKTVALCHGVFDLLHPGHFEHFRQASDLADFLIVSITADEFVNKGPGRPLFNQVRTQTLATLEMIDYVVISDQATAEEVIRLIRPEYYVKGPEYSSPKDDVTGMIFKESAAIEAYGGKVYFTGGITSSSSLLINRFYSSVDIQAQNWIKIFKESSGYESVLEFMDKISNLKVLILGEAIIDQYTSCAPLAKSSKDPILAFHELGTSYFPGGVLAIANSCSEWAMQTKVITFRGVDDEILRNVENEIKYRKKFELLKANKIRNIIFQNNKNE